MILLYLIRLVSFDLFSSSFPSKLPDQFSCITAFLNKSPLCSVRNTGWTPPLLCPASLHWAELGLLKSALLLFPPQEFEPFIKFPFETLLWMNALRKISANEDKKLLFHSYIQFESCEKAPEKNCEIGLFHCAPGYMERSLFWANPIKILMLYSLPTLDLPAKSPFVWFTLCQVSKGFAQSIACFYSTSDLKGISFSLL